MSLQEEVIKDIGSVNSNDTQVNENFEWDFDEFVDQISDERGGVDSRSKIKQVLMDVLPAFEGARVKTFVPIFLRRKVLKRLRSGSPSD